MDGCRHRIECACTAEVLDDSIERDDRRERLTHSADEGNAAVLPVGEANVKFRQRPVWVASLEKGTVERACG
jgi:hypothetical protein